jgi:hypothetical protein
MRDQIDATPRARAMMILVLTFVTLFLAIFSPCLVILHRSEQTKGFSALKQQQGRIEARIEARNEAAWRRNKQMLMD